MSDPLISLPEASAAFAMGVLGSTHCVGMCGGIASALAPAQRGAGRDGLLLLPLWMAAGRISTYAGLGAVVGTAGGLISTGLGGVLVPVLRGLLGLLLVAVGLSIAGWWPRSMAWFEALGGIVWKRLAPIGPRLMPVDSIARGLGVGALWGFLPCGLVYAALAAASVSGASIRGAIWMALFGLGTVPAVAGAGWLAGGVRVWVSGIGARRGAGVLLLASGIWTAAMPVWSHFNHGAHGSSIDEPHRDHGSAPDHTNH